MRPATNTILGMAIMLMAMQIVPISDALAKILSGEHGYSASQTAWFRIAISGFFLLPWGISALKPNMGNLWQTIKPHWLRGACWAATTLFFFTAIKQNPLPVSLALLFVAPLFVTVTAPIFLGEHFSRRRLAAAVVGFCGVIIILRPTADFSPSLIWALLSGLCYGAYLMATRHARHGGGGQTAFMTMLTATIIITPFVEWRALSSEHLHLVLAMGMLSAAGHLMIAKSCEYADISKLAPLTYSEMISTMLISYWLFNELPDIVAAIGMILIIAAGIYAAKTSARV
ncbi:MAG: DMT family transporter [Gammaproteobacteria bacterium WSBS_2016_MAG_OTU1]